MNIESSIKVVIDTLLDFRFTSFTVCMLLVTKWKKLRFCEINWFFFCGMFESWLPKPVNHRHMFDLNDIPFSKIHMNSFYSQNLNENIAAPNKINECVSSFHLRSTFIWGVICGVMCCDVMWCGYWFYFIPLLNISKNDNKDICRWWDCGWIVQTTKAFPLQLTSQVSPKNHLLIVSREMSRRPFSNSRKWTPNHFWPRMCHD